MVFGIIQVQLFAISIFCFCAVFSHVNLQLKRQFAEVFAFLTFIGLFSSVFEVVSLESTSLIARINTLLTPERFLS